MVARYSNHTVGKRGPAVQNNNIRDRVLLMEKP